VSNSCLTERRAPLFFAEPKAPCSRRKNHRRPVMHLVHLVDRLVAQKVWVDLVPGMPLAGVPLRPDRPQPELPHQPPDAPAANLRLSMLVRLSPTYRRPCINQLAM
jgi:hypothetical protein